MVDLIWKYPFEVQDEFRINVPAYAKFLKVDNQANMPVIWFHVTVDDDTRFLEQRTFRVIGTGCPFDSKQLDYRGTFQLFNGSFVGHLYEVISQ